MTVMAMKLRGEFEAYETEKREKGKWEKCFLFLFVQFYMVIYYSEEKRRKEREREITRRWSRERKKGLSMVFIWEMGVFGISNYFLHFIFFSCNSTKKGKSNIHIQIRRTIIILCMIFVDIHNHKVNLLF